MIFDTIKAQVGLYKLANFQNNLMDGFRVINFLKDKLLFSSRWLDWALHQLRSSL